MECSKYYRTYSNVLQIRSVSGEYLVAMKLMSGRKYKNDISDIIGILREEEQNGTPITAERMEKAVCTLYGSWEKLPEDSVALVKEILSGDNLEALYKKYRRLEQETKSELIAFEKEHPKVLRDDNLDEVISALRRKSIWVKRKERS